MDKETIRKRINVSEKYNEPFLAGLSALPLRVAGYKRTGVTDQVTSIELQAREFEQMIQNHSKWRFAGMYVDEGRDNTARDCLIDDCRKGKVDLIITRSVVRFGQTLSGTVKLISRLQSLNPPVGVYFESEGLYTLDEGHLSSLLTLEAFTAEEMRQKAETMMITAEGSGDSGTTGQR